MHGEAFFQLGINSVGREITCGVACMALNRIRTHVAVKHARYRSVGGLQLEPGARKIGKGERGVIRLQRNFSCGGEVFGVDACVAGCSADPFGMNVA